MPRTTRSGTRRYEQLLRRPPARKYVLRLYIAGATAASSRAIANVRAICERDLPGRYQLEVVDILQQPLLAVDGQIIAAPTMVKLLPPPIHKFIGDMSRLTEGLAGLELRPVRPR